MSLSPVHNNSIGRSIEAPPPGFTCAVSYCGLAWAWVRAAGELDIAAALELEQILRDAVTRARLLLLDLRELEFIDSSGVHVFGVACVRAKRAPCRVVVIHGSPQVQRMFVLTGLDRLIETVAEPGRDQPRCAPVGAGLL